MRLLFAIHRTYRFILPIARQGTPPREDLSYDFDTHGGVEAQYKLRLLIFTI